MSSIRIKSSNNCSATKITGANKSYENYNNNTNTHFDSKNGRAIKMNGRMIIEKKKYYKRNTAYIIVTTTKKQEKSRT